MKKPRKPGAPPRVTRIDRRKSRVVAPKAGLKVEMETVSEGNYRGLSLSFEEFVPTAGDVLPFPGRRTPAR